MLWEKLSSVFFVSELKIKIPTISDKEETIKTSQIRYLVL